MQKTIIKIKTWGCDSCHYKQDFEPTPENMIKHKFSSSGSCPSCGEGKLKKETNADKKIKHIVMGEEDIDEEIERIKKGEHSKVDAKEVSTSAKENAYRNKRKQEIKEAIAYSKQFED